MTKLKDQALSLATFAKDTVVAVSKGEHVKATPEEATRRYQICLTCPAFKETKCTKCGCNMGFKVQWQAAKCADKENPKW